MNKILVNDEVIILAGKDKGKVGNIGAILPGGKVMVDGLNLVKKHMKPNPNTGVSGGIVDKEMAIDISNVALVDPASKQQPKDAKDKEPKLKPTKVGIRINDNGKKERFYKSTGDAILDNIKKANKGK